MGSDPEEHGERPRGAWGAMPRSMGSGFFSMRRVSSAPVEGVFRPCTGRLCVVFHCLSCPLLFNRSAGEDVPD